MKPIVNPTKYYEEAVYICSCDMEQKKNKEIKTDGGDVIKLYTGLEKNRNHRISHPNVGIIKNCYGETEFKEGDEIITTHFAFEEDSGKSKSFYNANDVDYFKITNFDLIAGFTNGKLTPRKYNLLCKPLESKMVETELSLTGEKDDRRRDVVRVTHIWNGCEDYEVGDLVMIEKNGDYYFEYKGEEYIKVDTHFDDVVMKVDSEDWRKDEIHTHSNDHYRVIDTNNK